MTVPAFSFDDVVGAVQARAWYLRCHGPELPSDTGGWLAADRLAADHALLAGVIARTGSARGADRASVAAALFVQAYTFQVAGMAVAAWALGLPSPTLEPARLRVHVGPARPDDVAADTTALTPHTARSLVGVLVDDHLAPLLAAVRHVVRVGGPALWGNTAASLATVVRSVDGPGPGGDPAVRARGAELLTADDRLAGAGAWFPVGPDPEAGWRWERRSCCLWLRTAEAGGRRCIDCTVGRRGAG